MTQQQQLVRLLSEPMDIRLRDEMASRFLAERAVEAPGGIVLMLDRFLGCGMDEEVLKERGCPSAYVPLKHFAYQSGRMPVIYRIRPQDSDLIGLALKTAILEQSDQAIETTTGLTVSGWLEADVPLDVLAQYLATRMEQRGGGLGRAGLFRLADRRVLELAWELLDDPQRSILLGPISSWHIINRRGCLRSLYRPVLENDPGILRAVLDLSQQQLSELGHCQQIQEMLRGWGSIVEELPHDYLQRVRSALKGARNAGLSGNQDVLLLAAYTLQIHPRLAFHPDVQTLVSQSIEERVPLVDVLASIPDPEGWQRIKGELGPVGFSEHPFEAATNQGN